MISKVEGRASNATEIDIYRAAQQMIDTYKKQALLHAVIRSNNLWGEGDREGSRVWHRIIKAIKIMETVGESPMRLN